ncbi:hypothetical protein K7957_13380 [Sphingomonas yunnanensis]|uniref:hypothetical protein n=1 Tax=Sphingomonas yunnanensis TaxID=310400 RepID=UPI001CA7518B|nr:hypothetical protein [Sphingomonas yunnanensis]MBY9063930.1 hypothetical protein [Sphingomonas yunnanensis]
MSDDRANAGEGADPATDIDQQNDGTTTEDLAEHGTGETRAGAGEGPDAGAYDDAVDEDERD